MSGNQCEASDSIQDEQHARRKKRKATQAIGQPSHQSKKGGILVRNTVCQTPTRGRETRSMSGKPHPNFHTARAGAKNQTLPMLSSAAHIPRWSLSSGNMPPCSLRQDLLSCLLFWIDESNKLLLFFMLNLLSMIRLAVMLLDWRPYPCNPQTILISINVCILLSTTGSRARSNARMHKQHAKTGWQTSRQTRTEGTGVGESSY